jgi:glutaminyl-tRNA synthetase
VRRVEISTVDGVDWSRELRGRRRGDGVGGERRGSAQVRRGDAYVDSQTAEDMKLRRGSLTSPGEDSPYRDRTVDENLQLLEAMRNGDLPAGSAVLRAKIDMASPNLNLRDPALYRVKEATHPRTGDAWRLYPMYDFAHALSDAIEGITHSLCTLEFEDHRC